MPNIDTIISGYNKKILCTTCAPQNLSTNCNCRGGSKNCPINGNCLSKSIVYKAEIPTSDSTAKYIGVVLNSFKERFLIINCPLIIKSINITPACQST